MIIFQLHCARIKALHADRERDFFFSIDAFVAKYAEASPLLRFGENSSTAFDFAGGATSNPTEIRKHAMDLYGNLFTSRDAGLPLNSCYS